MPQKAFTLVELVVIVAVVGVIGLLLAPVLASARLDSRAVLCANNQRQVTMAWNMYVGQGGGLFPPNIDSDPGFSSRSWVNGILDYNGSTDDTNTYCLTGINACLSRYIKNAAVYKCPADQSRQFGKTGLPRNRSISMNAAIGPNDMGTTGNQGQWLPQGAGYKVYIRMADVVQPSPANLWLLTEEDPDSINGGSFAVEMPTSPQNGQWIDFPAKYHEKSCNFAFVDGHVLLHKWVAPYSIPDIAYGRPSTSPMTNFTDLQWVARRTSALTSGAPLPF
jgi:prepilin-type processing-associated H-X9-DG protein